MSDHDPKAEPPPSPSSAVPAAAGQPPAAAASSASGNLPVQRVNPRRTIPAVRMDVVSKVATGVKPSSADVPLDLTTKAPRKVELPPSDGND